MKTVLACLCVLLMGMTLTACSPKVGSKEWCVAMQKKPKGEWTTDQIGQYAKHCMFN